MKTPRFWASKNWISTLLLPLGKLYGWATKIRLAAKKPYKAGCPVICVGNITAGGTGKTPVSLALAGILRSMGKNPFFLTRGYGGKLKNVIVDPLRHKPSDVGDEPLLLAEKAPVAVNPDRGQGAVLACSCGADILVMDDGYQNPTLFKDISFLVFDGEIGIGNERIVPSGPLRESLEDGLKRADAVIILGDDKHNLSKKIKLPVFRGKVCAVKPKGQKRPILAFAGIGRPQKLYDSLADCGLKVVKTFDFPDHHFYTRQELEQLIDLAKGQNFDIFTTAKDYVKIPADLQKEINVLRIDIVWDNPEALQNFIKERIGA